MAAALAAATPLGRALARSRFRKLTRDAMVIRELRHSAFPYDGVNPDTNEPFITLVDGKRPGHVSPRGGVLWQDETYSDRRSLLYLPKGFDLAKPAALMVFLHGNEAILQRDVVDRQQVPQQLADSGLNAALVAPQLAHDARDSSPGNFWRAGYFRQYLKEAGSALAKLHGQEARGEDFDRLPVILVAYSGGYFPAAWILKAGGANQRISGLILMDALYGDTEKFDAFIAERHAHAFVFSAYGKSSARWNTGLMGRFAARGFPFTTDIPQKLKAPAIAFAEVPEDIKHVDFLSQAWTQEPLRDVLARVSAYRR
ncbi:alpha/beta hydrolase [Aestuariivirga sp.]|uniref:alpha/beta hydrolase n=1 Tax=Aestuariivirga sp. TaxID=2650926 RepID=UPI0039E5CBF2